MTELQYEYMSRHGCGSSTACLDQSTRIALSERGRELATLRVLGFSRAEISYILLGEVALLILIGLGLRGPKITTLLC